MSVYANLSHRRRTKRDASARRKAEYLASLPKHPVKRFFYRLHPKRVLAFWFSKRGALMALKITGVFILFMVLLVGALFAYYRKDLDQIRPGELNKRVQTTVTKYYDRNGKLLWEDTGEGNYKLVVKSDEISKYMKQATVAIEDKDFYHHGGVSVSGLMRAAISNLQGDNTQGGSTLTQQLVKQVFFADEANQRGLSGVPRKIKEMILAVEVERMYDKDQILTLYLNESPYGGRRNGVESAAETYFGTSAKDLTLPQAALLAAIPNQPGLYDPYNSAGNSALIERQHRVLDDMVDQGYITQSQADKAKKVPILDTINPQADQYKNIKAPHFVQMVRSELEAQLGKATVGRGGLIVKTTLDLRIQNKLQTEMTNMFKSYWPSYAGFTNGAGTIEDVRTGQILAMVGSRNFNYPGFGQDNAAISFIQPASSVKPLVYAQLFTDQGDGNPNFGSGSILSDTKTTFGGNYTPQDADSRFKGNITIRNSLDWSRNIPAIKAMAIAGEDKTLATIRAMGDKYYCTRGAEKQAGLSAAIGGCGTRMVDHVNAIASLARMGVYKPHSDVLEVRNSSGDVLQKYADNESKRIINTQSAYIVNDILGDARARAGLFGHSITPDLDAAGVRYALKTGTSDINLQPKDIWTVVYTPTLAGAVWLGNPDTSPLTNGNSSIPAVVLDPVMTYAVQLYQKEGLAKPGEWFTRPAGIKVIRGELYPSYYDKAVSMPTSKMTFDRISKKLASSCTPAGAKIEVSVTKMKDPLTKQTINIASDGYDATKHDDMHKCSDVEPQVTGISVDGNRIVISVDRGTFALDNIDVRVDGKSIATINAHSSGQYSTNYEFGSAASYTITATATDRGYYTGSGTETYNPPGGGH